MKEQKFEPRAMTYDEREAFIEAGLDVMFFEDGKKTDFHWERGLVKFVREMFPGPEFGALTWPKAVKFAHEVYRLTLAREDEELKN